MAKAFSDEEREQMKMDYISGMSYSQVARKYGAIASTVRRYGCEGKWSQQRDEAMAGVGDDEGAQKVAQIVKDYQAEIFEAADKILEKLMGLIDLAESGKELRSLTAALKDLQDIRHIRSDLDRRLLEAQINKLNRESMMSDDGDDECGVILLPNVREDDHE